jgi:glycosyltransferase involved in cell wall biosynthesis
LKKRLLLSNHSNRAHPEISITRFPVKAYPLPYFEADNPTSVESERLEGEGIRRGFYAALARSRPHVVIVGRGLFVWHVAELARESGIPFIVVMHDNSIISRIAQSQGDPVSAKLLAQLKRAACLVAVADHLGSAMRAIGLTNIKVIPNTIDERQFIPRPKDQALLAHLGLGPGDKVVLHASNMRPAKRPLDVIASAQQVLGRTINVTYLIAGDGPLRADMEAECQKRGVENKIRFAG